MIINPKKKCKQENLREFKQLKRHKQKSGKRYFYINQFKGKKYVYPF